MKKINLIKEKILEKEWDYDKNTHLDLSSVNSSAKVWWICHKGEDHKWQALLCDRLKKGTGCPYCSGRNASSKNNLSLMFPELLKEWDNEKNKVKPTEILPNSMKKIWWKCSVSSEHRWQATPNNRTSKKHKCPYCSGKKPDSNTSLLSRYPELCEEWDNEISPSTVLPNSHKKFWWKCKDEPFHRWQATPNNRVAAGSGCPFCNESGGEAIIGRILLNMHIPYSKQFRFPECKFKRTLPFDFAIHHNDKFGLIEFQGGQHYMPVKLFGGEEQYEIIKKRDKIKKEYCEKELIPLLVISYRESKNIKSLISAFVQSLR